MTVQQYNLKMLFICRYLLLHLRENCFRMSQLQSFLIEKANLYSLTFIVGSICRIGSIRRTMEGKKLKSRTKQDDQIVFQVFQ